ncbi:hypothetical protein BGZ57DRAFT_775105, partial [Hyaloscypha finlandica]
RTLFKGLRLNLYSFIPETIIGFYIYGNSKRFLTNYFNYSEESTAIYLLATALSRITTKTYINPL